MIVPIGRLNVSALEKLEESLAGHFGSAQQVLDDEHWNDWIRGNNQRTRHPRFGVDEMIAMLTHEREAILLKDPNQHFIRDWTKGGHYGTLATILSSETNSGALQLWPSRA